MKKHHLILATAVFFLTSLPLHAAALMTITGKLYSSNDREIGIQHGSRVYFINSATFSPAGKDAVLNSKKPITLRINPENLTRVTILKAAGSPKKKTSG